MHDMQPTSESEVAFSREHKKTVPNASEHVSIICVAYSCQSIIKSIFLCIQVSSYVYRNNFTSSVG